MISKQELAIGIVNTVISRWEETYAMLCEYPNLKKDLTYIRDLLQDKYFRKLKLAECHIYHILERVAYETALANDLKKIQKAIQDIGKELVHEAAIESACLLDTYGEADDEVDEKDLENMQSYVTRLENYIDPYIPEEDSNAKN